MYVFTIRTIPSKTKDDVDKIMGSAFQSRKYWFCYDSSRNIKDEVNSYCKGEKSLDTNAAKEVLKFDVKDDLGSDPFIRLLEYGNGGRTECYWMYEHMVLQLENCMKELNKL